MEVGLLANEVNVSGWPDHNWSSNYYGGSNERAVSKDECIINQLVHNQHTGYIMSKLIRFKSFGILDRLGSYD